MSTTADVLRNAAPITIVAGALSALPTQAGATPLDTYASVEGGDLRRTAAQVHDHNAFETVSADVTFTDRHEGRRLPMGNENPDTADRRAGQTLRELIQAGTAAIDGVLGDELDAMEEETREALREELGLLDGAAGDGLDLVD